jgi:peptidoglycan/LPS O-acetylase OafA/YrhL
MGVLGYHFYCPPCVPNAPSFIGNLLQAGFTLVSLFFVLSGFILAYNYLDDRGGFVGSTRDFYRARFARIYPIYLLALAVDLPLFLHHLGLSAPAATPGEVARQCVATLTLTQAWLEPGLPPWNTMAWTLSVEAFFYALFPWLGPWLARQGSRRLLGVAAAAWLVGTTPFLAGELVARLGTEGDSSLLARGLSAWSQLPSRFGPVAQLPQFVIGACLGLLFCRRTRPGSEAWRTAGLLATCAALATVIILLPPKPSGLINTAVLVPLFAVCIWLLACGVAAQGLALGTRPLVLLGGASYALYLLHGSLMGFALAINTRTLSLPHNVVALLTAPLAVAVSIALFRFVEEPARHWLRSRGIAESRALG